jgi:hypothetical protein
VNRRLRLAAFALLLGLSACTHTPPPEPQIKVVETKVPVQVPCHVTVEVHKNYSDAAAELITDIYEQAKALLQGRKERMADQKRLEGGVVSCGGTVTAK